MSAYEISSVGALNFSCRRMRSLVSASKMYIVAWSWSKEGSSEEGVDQEAGAVDAGGKRVTVGGEC